MKPPRVPPPLPPPPRTVSQELAAQLPTLPPPRNPHGGLDPRAEDEGTIEDAINLIAHSEAPKADRDRALVAIARELSRVSHHEGGQDLELASLRADLVATRVQLDSLAKQNTAQSLTLGGAAAESATGGQPKTPTIASGVEKLVEAKGHERLILLAVLVFEVLREFAPLLKGLSK